MMQTRYPFPKKNVAAFFLFLLSITCSHGISNADQTATTQRINSFDQHTDHAFLTLPFYLAEGYQDNETSNSYRTGSPPPSGGTTSDQGLEAEYNK